MFQAEDGIRDLVRSRGLGDVYKRQALTQSAPEAVSRAAVFALGCFRQPPADVVQGLLLSLIHI